MVIRCRSAKRVFCWRRFWRTWSVRRTAGPEFPGHLGVNLKALSRVLGLSTIEARVLGFGALLGSEEMLRSALALPGPISFHQACRMIGHLLDVAPDAIQSRLRLARNPLWYELA